MVEFKLKWHFMLKLLFPLILSMAFCILFTTIFLYQESKIWVDDTGNYMINKTFENIDLRANTISSSVTDFFEKIVFDFDILSNYTSNLFNDKLPVNFSYSNYFAVNTIDSNTPILSNGINTKNSAIFKLGINDYASFINFANTDGNVNKSTTMNNIWRSLYQSDDKYYEFFFGFTNGLYRYYPYSRKNNLFNINYICKSSQLNIMGYDPRCISWYENVKNSNNTNFSSPYIDVITNNVIITASKSLWMDGNLIGINGVTIRLDSLNEIITSSKIMNKGFSFIIDNNGNVIVYPKLNTQTQLFQIENVLFTKQDERNNFANIKNNLVNLQNGKLKYIKDNEEWNIIFRKVNYTSYILCMTIPSSEITEESSNLKNKIFDFSAMYAGVTALIMIILCLIFIFVNYKISEKITDPLTELIEKMKKITEGNLDVEMHNKDPESNDIRLLYENFQGLVHALRFGNDAYYKGNFKKALDNYNIVLKMMEDTNNIRGYGVCCNNMGAVYMNKKTLEAETYYNKAIQNAEFLLNEAINSNNSDNIRLCKIVYAKRLMNYGIYHKEVLNNSEEARKFYIKSLNLHKEANNQVGIAQVCGNIGQMYLDLNKIHHAQEYIDDVYENIAMTNDDEAKQYAEMNKAILAKHMNNINESVYFFVHLLTSRQNVNRNIYRTCVYYLLQICSETDNFELKGILEKISGIYLRNARKIYFVLDRSGSMAGSALAKCKQYINIIVNEHINEEDFVALYTFSTDVTNDLPLVQKRNNHDVIIRNINSVQTKGQTAFYSALEYSIMHCIENKNTESNTWIISLTDGEDNQSNNDSLSNIKKMLAKTNITMMTITVGNLQTLNDINSIIKSCGNKDSRHIRAENFEKIGESFQEVINCMKSYVEIEKF
jgi:uncharacterized protein with von Willebrand factor type A (vWA) domain